MKQIAIRHVPSIGFALAFVIMFSAGVFMTTNLCPLIESNNMVSHTLSEADPKRAE